MSSLKTCHRGLKLHPSLNIFHHYDGPFYTGPICLRCKSKERMYIFFLNENDPFGQNGLIVFCMNCGEPIISNHHIKKLPPWQWLLVGSHRFIFRGKLRYIVRMISECIRERQKSKRDHADCENA
jgi:hypothetical protein